MDLKRSMLSEEASLKGYVRGVIPSPASTGTPFVEHIIILHDSMYITVRQRQNYRKKDTAQWLLGVRMGRGVGYKEV